jgi:hypothetical protein
MRWESIVCEKGAQSDKDGLVLGCLLYLQMVNMLFVYM